MTSTIVFWKHSLQLSWNVSPGILDLSYILDAHLICPGSACQAAVYKVMLSKIVCIGKIICSGMEFNSGMSAAMKSHFNQFND